MMKKTIALLLVVIMAFSLVACGGGAATPDKPDDSAAPSDSSKPAPAEPTEPEEPAAEPSGEDVQPADTPSGDAPAATGDVGYYADALENAFNREKYEFVFIYNAATPLTLQEEACLQKFGEKLNFTLEGATPSNDNDKYITMIEEYAMDGVDGFVFDMDPAVQARGIEILEEYDCKYVCLNNTMTGSTTSTSCVGPTVICGSYDCGQIQMSWLVENYKNYWGDIDPSEIGYIGVTYSALNDINMRCVGAYDKFVELLPGNADKAFYADCVSGGMNIDSAVSETTNAIVGNSSVKYWFIVTGSSDMGTGAARAVESLGKDDCVLVTVIPASPLIAEWETGYKGCWVAGVDFAYMYQASLVLSGLCALCDGRATLDSLWADKRAEGDVRTKYQYDAPVLTIDTYKEYYNDLYAGFGFDPIY